MTEIKTKEGVKFSEEEMSKISSVKERYNEITVKLGQLEIEQKILDEQKARAGQEYNKIRKEEVDYAKVLSDKYGTGNLDLSTGVFIPSE